MLTRNIEQKRAPPKEEKGGRSPDKFSFRWWIDRSSEDGTDAPHSGSSVT
jgi:hypothetical protein